jgi:arylsulfatase A-like enzyme
VPARRSIISGQFPARHGALANVNSEWHVEHTLASVFRDSGYQTAWIGRSMHQYPVRKRFGFEECVISDHRLDDDYDEFLRRNMPEAGGGYHDGGPAHNDWTARPFHLPEQLHHTNWTVYEALRFLKRRDPTRPFLLVASFGAVHPPLVPPAFYFERYLRTGVPEPVYGGWATPPPDDGTGARVDSVRVHLTGEMLLSARAGYYGLINHLDDQIRRLMKGPLGGVSQTDTVILYTSDHGEMLGDHYMWRKSVPYQGSVRVPLLVRAPERFGIRAGVVVDRPVCLEDVMPTLLDLAGVETPPTVQGRSLAPLMRGEDIEWRDWIHIEHARRHHTLTDGRSKYIWFAADGREQFFDLVSDPGELHDLSAAPEASDGIARWRERLVAELKDRPEGFSDGTRLVPGRPYPAEIKR